MDMSINGWYYWAFAAVVTVMAPSWLLFGRLTMARIEKSIKADGKPRPCPWDGPGARIVWYAWAIAVPVGRFNPADDPLIDVPLVRKHSTRIDKVLATTMLSSTWLLILLTFLGI